MSPSLPERLLAPEQPAQNSTALGVGCADGVARAGGCGGLKHGDLLLGVSFDLG